MSQRRCGTCNECCIQPRIVELHKSAGKPCKNLKNKRCSIYEDRPGQCKEFSCLWLDGHMPKSQKPSKTKVLAWHNDGFCSVLAPDKIPKVTWDYLMEISNKISVVIQQPKGRLTYRNGFKQAISLKEAD